jgi:hypothetical protein
MFHESIAADIEDGERKVVARLVEDEGSKDADCDF